MKDSLPFIVSDGKRIEFYGVASEDEIELQIFSFIKELGSRIEAVCVTQNSKKR